MNKPLNVDDRYLILSKLGHGRWGSVYKVQNTESGQIQALKKVSVSSDLEFESFKHEFKMLSQLQHPNIVAVYDFDVLCDGTPFYTMEFVEGAPIRRYFERLRTDCRLLRSVLRQICQALAYFHARGIVHQDLKPENILISESRQDLIVKISDFGLAELLTHESGSSDGIPMIKGTYPYMSPEVLSHRKQDARSDLYSLGVVLYELISGWNPFTAVDVHAIAMAHLQKQPPPLVGPIGFDDSELCELVMQLLEKEAAFRPRSADAVLAAICDEGHESIPTHPLTQGISVGQGEYRKQILSVFEKTLEGHGGIVVVGGSVGVGKSRLLDDLRADFQVAGADVQAISLKDISENGTAVLEELLNRLKGIIPHQVNLDDPLSAYFFESVQSNGWTSSRWRFRRVAESILSAMNSSGQQATTHRARVIVIRDFHTDAREPWSFFIELGQAWKARTSNDAAYLWLIETRSEIGYSAAEMAMDDRLKCIRVQPFLFDETSNLLSNMLHVSPMPSNLVRQIQEITEGNALLVTLVAQSLHHHGAIEWRDGKWRVSWEKLRSVELTSDVSKLFEGLIHSLDSNRITILKHASLWDREFEIRKLLFTLPDNSEIENLFPGFIRDGFLSRIVKTNKTMYCFRQPLLRGLLHEMIPEDERCHLHRRISDTLINVNSDDIGEIAWHLFEAGEGGLAIDYAVEAAAQLTRDGHIRRAVDLYRKTLACVPDDRNEIRPRIHFELARNFVIQDEHHLVIDALHEAHTLLELPDFQIIEQIEYHLLAGIAYVGLRDFSAAVRACHLGLALSGCVNYPSLQLRLTTFLSYALSNLKQSEEAIRIVNLAISSLPLDSDPLFAGILYSTLANAYYTLNRFQEAETAQRYAVEFGEAASDPIVIADRYLVLGKIFHQLGKYQDGLREYARALPLIRLRQDNALLAEVLSLYGSLKNFLEPSEQAVALLDEGVAIAEQTDRLDLVAANITILSEVMISQGKLDIARNQLLHAMECNKKATNPILLIQILSLLARIAGRQGEWRQAIEYYTKMLDTSRRTHNASFIGYSYLFLANALKYIGVYNRARFFLSRSRRIFEQSKIELPDCDILEAEIALGTDDIVKAIKFAKTGLNHACRIESVNAKGNAHRVLGIIYHKQGDFEKSRTHLHDSISNFEQNQDFYEMGITRFALADLFSTISDIDRASLELDRARDLFTHIGAKYYLEKVNATSSLIRDLKSNPDAIDPMLSTFEQLTQLIASITDLDKLLGEILDVAIRFVHAERGMVILNEPETGEPEIRALRNLDGPTSKDAWLISRTVLMKTADAESCVFTGNAAEDPRFSTVKSVRSYNILSLICVPLKNLNKCIGVIYVDSRRTTNLFSDRDRRFLQAFANLAAATIDRSAVYRLQEEEAIQLRLAIEDKYRFDTLIGKSKAMEVTFNRLRNVIRSDVAILLTGNSGTGKDLAACAVHYNGPRKKYRFVAVNCAAIPETLVESELFGYMKGAFTDAKSDKEGKFEAADKGTLFLDEVGELPISVQAKLLRVIEKKEITRLGDDRLRKVDVRIIAATNRDLQSEMQKGRFREDLYYRLCIAHINMPDLKERPEDIPMLVQHFLQKACERNKRKFSQISPRAMEALTVYSWPGNVRELENMIESAVVFGTPPAINLKDLPTHIVNNRVSTSMNLRSTDTNSLEAMEKIHIQLILDRCGGNKSRACELLGISRPTLDRKIKQFNPQSSQTTKHGS